LEEGFRNYKVIGQLNQGYSLVNPSSIKQVKGLELIQGVTFVFGSCCPQHAVKGALSESETDHH